MEPALLATAAAWEPEGQATGEIPPISGAVDDPFLERMMLGFMDLVSGYLLFEEVAALGLTGMVVVHVNGSTLSCRIEDSENVRKVSEAARARGLA